MQYTDRKITRPGTTRRGRLEGFDYSYPGYYFITICTHNRQMLFGEISNEAIILSPTGRMLHDLIRQAEDRFSTVTIEAYVVMPNHIHILIGLAIRTSDEAHVDNIVDVIRWLKDASVRRHSLGVKEHGWDSYHGHLWQKGFHDHIVRNERELEQIRVYIATNVEVWKKDKFHDGYRD
jgi:putative transposase